MEPSEAAVELINFKGLERLPRWFSFRRFVRATELVTLVAGLIAVGSVTGVLGAFYDRRLDGHLVGCKALATERLHPASECALLFVFLQRHSGAHDLAVNRHVGHVVQLLDHALDLGGKHLLAPHVDHLRHASEDSQVFAVLFDGIARDEPAVFRERAGAVQITERVALWCQL